MKEEGPFRVDVSPVQAPAPPTDLGARGEKGWDSRWKMLGVGVWGGKELSVRKGNGALFCFVFLTS